jgi:transposase
MPDAEVTYGPKRMAGETRAMVLRHKLNGLTTRQIAQLCEVSTQAIYEHLERLRSDGLLPEDES